MQERPEERLADKSCARFAEELAGRSPVPGGGGAAAYAGALAAALCSMAGQFTLGKRRYAAVEADVRRMVEQAGEVRRRLVELVDEDARGFLPLSRAYALPKGDPARPQAIQDATRLACEAPLAVMGQACRAIELLEEMGEKGSALLVADVGTGAHLARAALEAASLNVFVNAAALEDRACAKDLEARCDGMLAAYVPRAQALARSVTDRVRGRG